MCLFVLKQFSTLPVHDHPGMTVLRLDFCYDSISSKLIQGDLHSRTYEWTRPNHEQVQDPQSRALVQGV